MCDGASISPSREGLPGTACVNAEGELPMRSTPPLTREVGCFHINNLVFERGASYVRTEYAHDGFISLKSIEYGIRAMLYANPIIGKR